MMRVYHDLAGNIQYTIKAAHGLVLPEGEYVEVELEDLDVTAFTVADGALVPIELASPAYKVEIEAKVNILVGRARSLFITDTPGQQMTYLAKQTESREVALLGQDPTNPTDYPFLYAEIGITGPTVWDVAQVVLNLAYQWALIGSNMEKLRMGTNAQLNAATTRAEVQLAFGTFKATLNGFLQSVGQNAL